MFVVAWWWRKVIERRGRFQIDTRSYCDYGFSTADVVISSEATAT
jgi:hypothetical protein